MKSVQIKVQANQQLMRGKVAQTAARMKLNRRSFPPPPPSGCRLVRVKPAQKPNKIGQSFIELTLFPAGHREDLWRLVLRGKPFLGTRQIERRQRGVEMNIERLLGSSLTVRESGERVAVANEELDLETRHGSLDPLAAVQFQLRRSQDHVRRLGWIFPSDEDDHPELPLERDVPDHGRIERDLWRLLQPAEILNPAEVLKVDLAVILTLPPTLL